MSFIVRNLTLAVVPVDDLGLEIPAGAPTFDFDMTGESAENVALSTDLTSLITAGTLIVLDPLDAVTPLSVADSIELVQVHNDPHYGIRGGLLTQLDDVDLTGVSDEDVLQWNGTTFVTVSPTTLQGSVLDPKDSVRAATTADISGTYAPAGGTGGTGAFTAVDLTNIDGVNLSIGDRVLIKNQTDPKENGIYVVTTSGVTGALERASDQDGTPANEVSGANFTFVENEGTANANSGWIVDGSGILTLNTDNIDWIQFNQASSFTAGAGLGLAGNQFFLDVDNLTPATIVLTDEIAFNDVSDTNTTRNTTVADFIADLGIFTTTSLTASDGITFMGADLQLDITNLTDTPVTTADELALDDGASGTHIKRTLGDIFNDLNVVNNIGGNGIVVQTADDTYAARTITASVATGLEGIDLVNGDGIAGNPTVGLDIVNLTAVGHNLAATDLFVVVDNVTGENRKMTGTELVAGISGFNSYGAITGDTGTSTSATASESLSLIGATNGGITTVAADGAPDSVTFAIDINDLLAGTGPIGLTDSFAVFDGTNVKFTFQELVDDLNIVNNIVGNGFVVQTAADTYASRTIVASTTAAEEGAIVTNGDGIAGNPTVGVDINGQTNSANDLAATDEALIYDGTNNVSMSGQQIADGVNTILNLGGMTVSTINGQPIVTYTDTTRGSKQLSSDTVQMIYGENNLGNNDWMGIGANAVDADSGFIIPLDATIVMVTAHCENTAANSKEIHVYADAVDVLTAGTLSGGTNAIINNSTANIDVAAGTRIRVRAQNGSGNIRDTVVTVHLRYRA